jgi:hypothetical protein
MACFGRLAGVLYLFAFVADSPRTAAAEGPGATPVTDPSAIDVCARVPGADVAKALGKSLKSAKPIVSKDSKLSRCVYILAAGDKPDAPTDGLVLWLYAPGEYDELRKVTEAKLEPVAGLGDEAVRFVDSGDGRNKVRVLRKGRFALEATAKEQASAVTLAKLAVERFDR